MGWLRTLQAQTGQSQWDYLISLPLVPRLVLAAVLVAWGASQGKRWTVLVAAFLALPAVWLAAVAMLVGLGQLNRRDPRPDL